MLREESLNKSLNYIHECKINAYFYYRYLEKDT